MRRIFNSPLLTDFYQLTMASGYYQLKLHEREASFYFSFRHLPFDGNYAISCGLASFVEFLRDFRFREDDLDYLASLKDAKRKPLFKTSFLSYLRKLTFTCDVEAVPEGTIVFPNEPVIRIQGPLLQCQLLETPLLTFINFQTLVATKAARICHAAEGDPVIEFGMRRAQGPDGALSASRAAYIGGCVATSNTLAGKLYDIPVRGTHAHSWVSAFPNEQAAFNAYANVMPDNCVLLVDTYNTLQGVKHAIDVGKSLRKAKADLLAIRLDSGDMATLSKKARSLLNKAGFAKTQILASNSLDEYVIASLKKKGAAIDLWGVGTHLATAYDCPALDGVYKLSALKDKDGQWEYKLKLSEQPIKTSNPGRHQVRRFFYDNQYVTDVIYDLDLGISDTPDAVTVSTPNKTKTLRDFDGYVDLLQPIFKRGKLVQSPESIHAIRDKAIQSAAEFREQHGNRTYVVLLEKSLHHLKRRLMKSLKK